MVGWDYSKNTKCYKNVKIETHKKCNDIKMRVFLVFNTGLTLFKETFNSLVYVQIH